MTTSVSTRLNTKFCEAAFRGAYAAAYTPAAWRALLKILSLHQTEIAKAVYEEAPADGYWFSEVRADAGYTLSQPSP